MQLAPCAVIDWSVLEGHHASHPIFLRFISAVPGGRHRCKRTRTRQQPEAYAVAGARCAACNRAGESARVTQGGIREDDASPNVPREDSVDASDSGCQSPARESAGYKKCSCDYDGQSFAVENTEDGQDSAGKGEDCSQG